MSIIDNVRINQYGKKSSFRTEPEQKWNLGEEKLIHEESGLEFLPAQIVCITLKWLRAAAECDWAYYNEEGNDIKQEMAEELVKWLDIYFNDDGTRLFAVKIDKDYS